MKNLSGHGCLQHAMTAQVTHMGKCKKDMFIFRFRALGKEAVGIKVLADAEDFWPWNSETIHC